MNSTLQSVVITGCVLAAVSSKVLAGVNVDAKLPTPTTNSTSTRLDVSVTSLKSAIYFWICEHAGANAFDAAEHFGIRKGLAVALVRELAVEGRLERA